MIECVLARPAVQQIAVRCCCQPKRILGWFLMWTQGVHLEPGLRVKFRLQSEASPILDADPFWRGSEFLELPLDIYVDEQGCEHLAFRADHEQIPMSQLLRADGFFTAN
jgi:hypothetical protein